MSLKWKVELGDWKTLAEQRAAAYRLLGELVGGIVVVGHDANGAPFLKDYPSLHISISHCRGAVAVAVNDAFAVGIDVESRRKICDGLVGRICTQEEQSVIGASTDPTMQFLHFWTRKEAVLKMRRTGIQGFGSMIEASTATDCIVKEIDCGSADIVAAVAVTRA